jgi:hypothetical protein
MPTIKPVEWDEASDRDVCPERGEARDCLMMDMPVMTLDDPILNPPEEE